MTMGSSSSSRRRSSRGTTQEERGAGEDAEVIFRSHRVMLLQRVNENKTLFGTRCYGCYCVGAREATIVSKRGSPRSGSQYGSSFNSP